MSNAAIDNFHFLRPIWLVVIPLAILLHWRLRRGLSASVQWKTIIAPHLLQHLAVRGHQAKNIRPYQLMTIALILASIAVAGPAWQREITPFTRDQAPLIIVLQLTPSMLSIDQAPTRLERAKQKIRDILERRKGARTALIAYAETAHTVLPLTDDSQLIELYLASLVPGLMPSEGNDPSAALMLANEMMMAATKAADKTNAEWPNNDPSTSGTILFMTDGIDRTHAVKFASHKASSEDQVLFLTVGTVAGGEIDSSGANGQIFGLVEGRAQGVDLGGVRAAADAAGSTLIQATPDISDVEALLSQVRSHLVNAVQDDDRLQWRDSGYWLVWPLVFLILVWSRRGWTVHWG